ncbi:MAG TPA: glycerol-3-phosphate 1-O-acyltransferase PlsY [Caldisericia bacterium]|nr:glycerol-3-phosphate 1-O-acyltransferase PlsY [Caldisericia bacterium]HPF48239.1 glycerol-3-phosphate 1-O-acyltransferase PlsY [Caldisericia bacterium]HPI83825.1 glycerol-3-phosphate 1-O-acyltransferase PlsY [Caldisericia bacterium]HPQ92692.1 glycerol-3-phosphate 1-O-acyltransferase PlsY [Caldisericia bacterium]HRV74210.1 glycerol-3-phosphate 1-O-acyltransferase PlsY [Caldisericia bacterium]
MTLLYWAIAGYLVGSIPFGLIIGKLFGVDVRDHGSGNIGATNVSRTVGIIPGALSFVLDMAKGSVPVFLALYLGFEPWEAGLVGACVFLGHCWSPFLLFKGGKGISTSFGIIVALDWRLGLAAGALWLILVLLWKMVSLSSILSISLVPFGFLLAKFDLLLFAVLVGMALIAVIKHIPNIRRIIEGSEYRVGERVITNVNQD